MMRALARAGAFCRAGGPDVGTPISVLPVWVDVLFRWGGVTRRTPNIGGIFTSPPAFNWLEASRRWMQRTIPARPRRGGNVAS